MKHFKELKVEKLTYMADKSLRELRFKKKIGLRAFSRMLKMSASTICSIEQGFHTTSEKTAKLIEKTLAEL